MPVVRNAGVTRGGKVAYSRAHRRMIVDRTAGAVVCPRVIRDVGLVGATVKRLIRIYETNTAMHERGAEKKEGGTRQRQTMRLCDAFISPCIF